MKLKQQLEQSKAEIAKRRAWQPVLRNMHQRPLPKVKKGQFTRIGERIDPSGKAMLYSDDEYKCAVYERDEACNFMDEEQGMITTITVQRADGQPARDWRDLQRIKNELCGPEREAVELFPAESRLIDQTNTTHLWVLPEGKCLPFGSFGERIVFDENGVRQP